MKKTHLIIFILLLAFTYSCQEDDTTFGEVNTPTNLTVNIDVANDQSGNVTVTPSADNAINFHVYFKQDEDPVVISAGEQATYRYTESGQYTQVINVIAYGTGGVSSSVSETIELDVILVIEQSILSNLAGNAGEGKSWRWDSSNSGHFGVGDPAENFPNFFSAAANQLNPCLYDDKLTFLHDGNGVYTYLLETNGETFMNWAEVKRFFPDAAPQEFVDECRGITDLSYNTDFIVITDPASNTSTLTVGNSTLSYWSGATSYEIIELTQDKLVVRGLQDPFDPPGATLAWYHTFVPDGTPSLECSGETGSTGSGNNDVLVWADEFDEDGAPCSENWQYNIGTGENGWGNGESQYYTDRPENVRVEDGVLKITAKAEDFNGSPYTSARIISKNNFEFTFGRVEVRAKLPTGGGTWPAIWLLGADFETNPWPAAGEIDIMEHVGNQQNTIFSSLHYPGNSGGNSVTESTVVPGVSDDFFIYEVNWTSNQIVFSVNGEVYHIFNNNAALPFNKDFFIILNQAMGGTFGGEIDPNFTESTFEIDYVRVYQ